MTKPLRVRQLRGVDAAAEPTPVIDPNDQPDEAQLTLTADMSDSANVGTIESHTDFPSKFVKPRTVEVWLPDGYDAAASVRYPVLYMHDGQFLFHHGNGPFKGTDYLWDVDLTMGRMIQEGRIDPAIVVAAWADLDAKPNRNLEYMPGKPLTDEAWAQWMATAPDVRGGTVTSDSYLRFLVEELKPFVDETYQTEPGPGTTFICGSSMGGMISAYAIAEYPQVFGGAACLSTHWLAGGDAVIDWYEDRWPEAGQHRIYFDHGTESYDAGYAPFQAKMDRLLERRGFQDTDWVSRQFEGADHSPRAWRDRLHIPLQFLLGQR